MKYIVSLFLSVLLCMPAVAQVGSDSVTYYHIQALVKSFKFHTKYDLLTEKPGMKVRIFDMNRPNIFAYDREWTDHRIRGVVNDRDTTFFVCLFYDNYWEYVCETDVRRMVDAIDLMQTELLADEKDRVFPYCENWFTTDDGVKIGYSFDKTKNRHWQLFHSSWGGHISIANKDVEDFKNDLKADLLEIDKFRKQ